MVGGPMLCIMLASLGGAGWPAQLSYSWEPHRLRVPVEITAGAAGSEGVPVAVPVGPPGHGLPLAGLDATEIRVTDESGLELLWSKVTAKGSAEVTGRLADGDVLYVPVPAGADGPRRVYVYADSPGAWPVPEVLAVGLTNPGFEAGSGSGPAGWVIAEADADHVMDPAPAEGRNGSNGARCTVREGAAARWVKYQQVGIPLTPGTRYHLAAWVRAEGTQGATGWFIHVNGAQPQLINQVLDAGSGTYDWKRVESEFTAPDGATNATVGTVLYGTGRAWYDDVSLEPVAGDGRPAARVLDAERLDVRTVAARPPSGWAVPVYNCASESLRNVLVAADVRPALIAWRRERGDYASATEAAIETPEGGPATPCVASAAGMTLLPMSVPSRSVTWLPVSFRPATQSTDESARSALAALCLSSANHVRPSRFEGPADLEAWGNAKNPEGRGLPYKVELDKGGVVGDGCLKLTVPKEAAGNWVGARLEGLPVRPGHTYCFGAFVRTGETGGDWRIYAHVRDPQGAVASFLNAEPGIAASSGWTWVSAFFSAPSTAATIDLHLTTNTWGTAWYDGVCLFEVVRAGLPQCTARSVEHLTVGVVDPMVKVFPDDMIETRDPSVSLTLARNEYEPCQLVVRVPRSGELRIAVDALAGPGGAHLDPVTVERVGFVRIDYPTSYYQTKVAAYARKLPTGSPASDGWPGLWPDPLIPIRNGATAADPSQCVPLWFTVRASAGATPGDYRGAVRLTSGDENATIPLTVTVRSFELPKRSRLRAVYDLRDGPLARVFDGPDRDQRLEAWYRLLAAHRVTPDTIHPEPVVREEDGRMVLDAAEFDRWAKLCLDELGMNHLYTPWQFYGAGWAYRPGKFLGREPFTPEYKAAAQKAYRLLIDHLTEHGWRDRLVHYVSDEPFFDNPQVVSDLQEFSRIFAEVAPDVPRYSSTWRPAPGLEGAISLWGAGHYGGFPVEKMRERQAAGDAILFTTDGQMCIDTPWCAVERLLPHYAHQVGAIGYEFWGVSWWTFDPWDYGFHSFISQSNEGRDYYWVRYPNGDGYLTYPGDRYGVNGPLSSIRLEQAREGQEDAEYLGLLTERVRRMREAGKATGRADTALAAAAALTRIPNAGGLRSTAVLPDPTEVARVRTALAEAIEWCDKELAVR